MQTQLSRPFLFSPFNFSCLFAVCTRKCSLAFLWAFSSPYSHYSFSMCFFFYFASIMFRVSIFFLLFLFCCCIISTLLQSLSRHHRFFCISSTYLHGLCVCICITAIIYRGRIKHRYDALRLL